MASELLSQIAEARDSLRGRTAVRPRVGVILGTGLGDFADALKAELVVPYPEIPHFPVSTVESHAGELHLGALAGVAAAVMKGRVHYYEGYTMQQVAFPVRVLKALGVETLVITSACGGMNPLMPAGTVVITVDHINLALLFIGEFANLIVVNQADLFDFIFNFRAVRDPEVMKIAVLQIFNVRFPNGLPRYNQDRS